MAIWLGWRHACCLIAEVPVFLGWFSNCFFQKFNLPRKRPLWPPVWQHHSRRSVSHLMVRVLLWTFLTLKWEEIHFGKEFIFEYNQHNLDMEMIHMCVLVFSCSDLTVNRQITVMPNVRIPERERRRLPRQCNLQKKGSLLLTPVRAPATRPTQWYGVRERWAQAVTQFIRCA